MLVLRVFFTIEIAFLVIKVKKKEYCFIHILLDQLPKQTESLLPSRAAVLAEQKINYIFI